MSTRPTLRQSTNTHTAKTCPPTTKSHFFPGEVMMLNVPCGRKGQFLNQRMAYLKFRVTNTSVITAADVTAGKQATITPDYSILSLISRLDIYHGSNLLEYDEPKRQCTWLFQQGKIRISNSPYATPIVMVRKADGSVRGCIDYRAIDERTVRD